MKWMRQEYHDILDNPEKYSKEQFKKAFSIAQRYLECFSRYYEIGLEIGRRLKDFKPSRIVYLGIGGSAIVGDFISVIVKDLTVRVHRDYTVLKINPDDLILAVSYSGDTAEIFPTILNNLDNNRRMVMITSGGALRRLAEKKSFPIVMLEQGIPPRYALPHTFGAVIGLIKSLDIKIEDFIENLDAAKTIQDIVSPETPTDRNLAKKSALKIVNMLPVVYGYGRAVPIAYRLKCQLNENSKLFSHFCEIPEALHNDIEVLNEKTILVAPRVSDEPKEINEVYRLLSSFLHERYIELKVQAGSIMEEILSLLILVDYISLYAAVLRDTDPLSLSVIPKLKDQNKIYQEILKSVDEKLEE